MSELTYPLIYPRLVYKDGGDQQRPGGSYSYLLVMNHGEYEAAVKSGWYPSLPEAIKWLILKEMHGAPTRAKLEEKAAELGIRFHPSISDAKLEQKITSKLGDDHGLV